MAAIRLSAVALTLACAVVCPAALAADEEPPQTGTIEGRVVYADSGEAVGGALVQLLRSRPRAVELLDITGTDEDGRFRFDAVALGDYHVEVRNPRSWPVELIRFRSSKLVYDTAQCVKPASVAAAAPVAYVEFEVQRGWRLSGRITRGDGTAIENAIVAVYQGGDPSTEVRGLTDAEGCYELLGLQPGRRIAVRVISSSWSRDIPTGVVGAAILYEARAELIEDDTWLDVRLPIASLEVEFRVTRALWPFRRKASPFGGISLGPCDFDSGELPDALLELPEDTTAYTTLFDELPANRTVVISTGFVVERRHVTPGAGLVQYVVHRLVRHENLATREGRQKVIVHVTEPYTWLSRVLWAAAPLLVLLIFGTILIKQVRKRRAKGAAT